MLTHQVQSFRGATQSSLQRAEIWLETRYPCGLGRGELTQQRAIRRLPRVSIRHGRKHDGLELRTRCNKIDVEGLLVDAVFPKPLGPIYGRPAGLEGAKSSLMSPHLIPKNPDSQFRRTAKGKLVNIPAPGCGFCTATQLNTETSGEAWKISLLSSTVYHPEVVYPEIGFDGRRNPALLSSPVRSRRPLKICWRE